VRSVAMGRQRRILGMRIRLPRAATSSWLKRPIAAILLLGVLVEIAGIPVVVERRKDRSRPYPCQDHPCGCASAEECWHHCCCMSNTQKVAWARSHGITPPDFVVAAAAQEGDQPQQLCSHEDGCEAGECSHHEERACCRARHAHHDDATVSGTEHETVAKAPPRARFVLSDLARRCNGLPQIIMLFSDALPCAVSAPWRPAEVVAGFVVEAAGPCASPDLCPPVPPPKLCGGLAA
jgi:hypothetical protein